jgi:uncharacterized protein (DUF1778 family)
MRKRRIKTRTLPVRMSEQEIDLIESAAEQVGESRSEFLRNAAKIRAQMVLGSVLEVAV